MIRRAKVWRAAAVLFGIVNLAGMGFALAMDEMMHAMAHAFLLFLGLGAYLMWKAVTTWAATPSGDQLSQASPRPSSGRDSTPKLGDQRIDYLQRSIDALAVEVERIGEAQRFRDKLHSEPGEAPLRRKLPPEE
ncbi:MAG TPA: hypothetical protein VK529_08780 [Gemmatimonadaceae bacterium]|jgi:hypothetical protein|nr:hypothetical protein [Gemmatimonadaceae bacterium]